MKIRSAIGIATIALGTLVTAPAMAATKSAASTKPVTKPVDAAPATIVAPTVPTGPKAPAAVKLRVTTPAEAQANAIWNVRAALNIAALQCQFLPFLATVRTYNDILRQHSEELNDARLTMIAHFKRYDGAKAQTSFDQYTTRTYNSFSTIDAQLPFCEKAAVAGREVLSTSKGKFGALALRINPEIRASLEPGVGLPRMLTTVNMTPTALPSFGS